MKTDISLISLALFSVVSIVSSMKIPLTNVLTKNPHTTCIRSCREVKTRHGVDDYTCGFSCLKIRGKVIKKRSKRDTKSSKNNYIHITPIPKNFKFYDINDDKGISLPEFARSLGHDPKKFHIRAAFSEVDKDSDGKIDAMEFHSDVLVFDGDGMFEDDDYNVDDSVISRRSRYDDDSLERHGGSSDDSKDSDDSSKDDDSNDDNDSSESDSSSDSSDDSDDSSDSSDSSDDSSDSSDSSSDSSDSSDDDDNKKRRKSRRKNKDGDDHNDDDDDSRSIDDGVNLPTIHVKDDKLDDTADDMIENVLDGIGLDGDDAMGGLIGDNMDDMIDDLGDGIGDIVENVNDAMGDAVDTMTDGAGDVIDNMKDGVENTMDAVNDMTGNVADAMSDVAGNMGDAVSDVAGNMGDAVGDAVDNINDMAGNVVDTVSDVMPDSSDAMNTIVAANLIANAAPPSIIPSSRISSRPQATLAGANRRLDIPPTPIPAVAALPAVPRLPNSPGVPSMWEDSNKSGSSDFQRNIANVVNRSNGGRTSVVQTARDDSIQWRF